jgi:nicotinamidase/pyrazinamidase
MDSSRDFTSGTITDIGLCYLPVTRIIREGDCTVASQSKLVLWEVDTQMDFMLPGGKLYVPGAEKLIPNIRRLVDTACENRAFLISSADHHTPEDPEFKIFPPHCIKGTEGARVIPEALAQSLLAVPNESAFRLPSDIARYQQVLIEKQTLNVFDNLHTAKIVNGLSPNAEFFVFGVVTEHCVRCAGKGLLDRGRGVSIVTDAIEQLDPAAGSKTIAELTVAGAKLITTEAALARLHSASAAK